MTVYDLRKGCITINVSGGGGGGGANFSEVFTSATSITILGSTHGFGRMPVVSVYDSSNDEIEADVNVDSVTFDVVVNLNDTASGTVVLV